ncbi:penicillin-binding protein 2 [Hyphomicrobium sp. xq]|uniref:Penicillin-binding protein 2 n=2 Tax=Hyphomicrobium album TaxID=2665159 RepID=A0A6I3KNX7_9HYPH|nr:penicillin-binding protein 2 [Hyphomicrobium album]
MALFFMAIGAQLVRLALAGLTDSSISLSETVAQSYARPDIVDRNGRLLATDVVAYSLFADPARVLDRDEVIEKLAVVFPDLDRNALRRDLSDRDRRFVWVRRGLPPRTAQAVHDLGLPGLDFRRELRRAYPGGNLAGHVLGYVNIDNKGVSGIERYVDDIVGVEAVQSATRAERPPVRLSLDIGVQHAVEAELADAVKRYEAQGAAGIVLDVDTGEIVASASLPEVDPARPNMDSARADKISGSTFELGSVFKTLTVAMAIDQALATPETIVDVRKELKSGGFTIKDLHPLRRPLTVAEIFLHSSNVGAAMLALQAGPDRFQAFLRHMQLTDAIKTEAGNVSPPQLPPRWGETETITASYGHGIALAPLQFAAAASAVVNGGRKVTPTYIKRPFDSGVADIPLMSAATSQKMRDLMRRNVAEPAGTGKRADVPGYQVGGKTGTAEMPGVGGYREKAVISSFLAAFPMDKPRYLVFVMLFEPTANKETGGEVLASRNAAPTTARVISRIGPLLGILPTQAALSGNSGLAFDAASPAKYEAR